MAGRVLKGMALMMLALPVWAAGCKGTQLSFTQQVSEQVAEDALDVVLYVQRQASTLVALNRQLNQASQGVARLKGALPGSVRLETLQWRTWPVYNKPRTEVVRWQGVIRYRLSGPLEPETMTVVQRLQSVLLVQQMQPVVVEATRERVRAGLEARLLEAARARLEQVRKTLGYRQADFATINLEAQYRPVGLRPMMAKAMRMADMPAPTVEGGEQKVSVSGRFGACLTR